MHIVHEHIIRRLDELDAKTSKLKLDDKISVLKKIAEQLKELDDISGIPAIRRDLEELIINSSK